MGVFTPIQLEIAMTSLIDLYRNLLGIPLGVTLTEEIIKSHFRKQSSVHHPDKGGSHELFISMKDARDYLLETISGVPVIIDIDFKVTLASKGLSGTVLAEGVTTGFSIPPFPNDNELFETSTPNIFVRVNIIEDSFTVKVNDDIVKSYHIDYMSLILGTVLQVRDISGKSFDVTINPLTDPSTYHRIQGRGYNGKGDMYIKFIPFMPHLDSSLIRDIKELLCLEK